MIIAEDLGFLTDDVRELLHYSGFPGMKVLQFAFDESENSEYLPHKYIRNSVVYTGTHDNRTLSDWVKTASPGEIKFAKKYLGVERKSELATEMIRAAMLSKSDTCIIPIQDWIGLGSEARVNTPGTSENNWRFRVRKRMLSKRLAEKILSFTECSGRGGS
jgi:4-alpha-glucanotransferase